MSIFDTCKMTQTIIFVNTKNFAETVFNVLKKKGYKPTIIFSNMDNKERDEMMQKFREGKC